MNKTLCLVLAAAMALTLVFTGCSPKTDETPGNIPGTNQGDNADNAAGSGRGLADDLKDGADRLRNDIKDGAEDILDGLDDAMPGTDGAAGTRDGVLENEQNMPSTSELLTGSAVGASSQVSGLDALSGLDNTKQGWGQGYNVNEKNQPESCVAYQQKYGQYGTYFLAPEEKVIYLTFDEGYENGYTAKILDVLKEKNVSAVFFVTMPYVKSEPELIRRMIDEGHVVGNHSVNHPSMPAKDLETCENEIMGLHQYMLDNYNYEMNLFRFPMGEFSERTLALTQSLGYHSVFWSFAYKDWEPENQPENGAAFKRVTGAVHPGAIYLLHAVSKTNTEILGNVIDTLRGDGYEFGKFDLGGGAGAAPGREIDEGQAPDQGEKLDEKPAAPDGSKQEKPGDKEEGKASSAPLTKKGNESEASVDGTDDGSKPEGNGKLFLRKG